MPYEDCIKLLDNPSVIDRRLERLLQQERAVVGSLDPEEEKTVRLLALAGMGGSY